MKSGPTFGRTKIPARYRDWRSNSVANEQGDLNNFAHILGKGVAIKAYRKGNFPFLDGQSLPGLACEVTCRRRRTTKSLAVPIFRGRAAQERSPVYGQGLTKNMPRLAAKEVAQLTTADPPMRRCTKPVLYATSLSRSPLCLHPYLSMPRVIRHPHTIIQEDNMEKVTYEKEITALLVIDPHFPQSPFQIPDIERGERRQWWVTRVFHEY